MKIGSPQSMNLIFLLTTVSPIRSNFPHRLFI